MLPVMSSSTLPSPSNHSQTVPGWDGGAFEAMVLDLRASLCSGPLHPLVLGSCVFLSLGSNSIPLVGLWDPPGFPQLR